MATLVSVRKRHASCSMRINVCALNTATLNGHRRRNGNGIGEIRIATEGERGITGTESISTNTNTSKADCSYQCVIILCWKGNNMVR